MSKLKTLPDDIENCSLKAILGAYGGMLSRNPASVSKWLYGLKFAPSEWAEYPMLARALQQSTMPKIVNFPLPAQAESRQEAA
jgi:hypothetical protein